METTQSGNINCGTAVQTHHLWQWCLNVLAPQARWVAQGQSTGRVGLHAPGLGLVFCLSGPRHQDLALCHLPLALHTQIGHHTASLQPCAPRLAPVLSLPDPACQDWAPHCLGWLPYSQTAPTLLPQSSGWLCRATLSSLQGSPWEQKFSSHHSFYPHPPGEQPLLPHC